jgi:hypothetical protein
MTFTKGAGVPATWLPCCVGSGLIGSVPSAGRSVVMGGGRCSVSGVVGNRVRLLAAPIATITCAINVETNRKTSVTYVILNSS